MTELETYDPEEVIEEAVEEHEEVYNNLREAAEWFHDHEGQFFNRRGAAESISDELDVSLETANRIVAELVSDKVDPIIQVQKGNLKLVGVHNYEEGDTWYAYLDYDDVKGAQRRVVCAQCVHECTYDHDATTAAEYEGSFGEAEWDELVESVEEHFEEEHDEEPSEVETGANLLSGTTIGGNTAWHAGNDGLGSGLDADTVDGFESQEIGKDPIYGDGSDGNVTRSSNGSESGIIYAQDYTIQSGVTRTVNGIAIIHASGSITVDGTLDASGQGGSGGGGGSGGAGSVNEGDGSNGTSGNSGSNADFSSGDEFGGGNGGNGSFGENAGAGGNGNNGGTGCGGGGAGGGGSGSAEGDFGGGNGGNGGDSGSLSNNVNFNRLRQFMSSEWDGIYNESYNLGGAGGGGGGGGGGGAAASSVEGGDGGNGGAGGDGGGVVVLISPRIDGSGTIDVSGTDGSDGQDGENNSGINDLGGGGGGGGGGAGGNAGAFIAVSPTITGVNINQSGGNGGSGGFGGSSAGDDRSGDGGDGGDGGNGANGFDLRIQ